VTRASAASVSLIRVPGLANPATARPPRPQTYNARVICAAKWRDECDRATREGRVPDDSAALADVDLDGEVATCSYCGAAVKVVTRA